MDNVPFITSGASSAAHYSLVRKIEATDSARVKAQLITSEIEQIKGKLSAPSLSNRQCREGLIVLLYCSMTADFLEKHTFDFAFRHAINLAETGQTTNDKTLGYLFCSELMPPDHELHLMLINTLRKDLESPDVPRICLALDSLIASSTEDFVPAVRSRLSDLVSHNSPHVRRRALVAFRALSAHDPELLESITARVVKRVEDRDIMVANAGLLLADRLSKEAKSEIGLISKRILELAALEAWDVTPSRLRLLSAFAGLSSDDTYETISLLLQQSTASTTAGPDLYALFGLLSKLSPATITNAHDHPIKYIQHLLDLEPNDIYTFLSCLECLDPVTWAGTAETPSILTGQQVERIMSLLRSKDSIIRTKTLRILNRIDIGIVESYYQAVAHPLPPEVGLVDKNDHAYRLVEIVVTLFRDDGEAFAMRVHDLLWAIDADPTSQVIESAVEHVLSFIRNSNTTFQTSCVTTLLTLLTNEDRRVGPSLHVILSALACEYCGKVSIPPTQIIEGLGSQIASYNIVVQEAALLSMLRTAAECESIPKGVENDVKELQQGSGRHIRRRCDQFLTLSHQPEVLRSLTRTANSCSLPDFAEALRTYMPPQPKQDPSSAHVHSSPSDRNLTSPKLRYDAYAAPNPTRGLRDRKVPDNHTRALFGDSHDVSRASSRSSRRDRPSVEHSPLPPIPRNLALGDSIKQIGSLSLADNIPIHVEDGSALNVRDDLIAFDSPSATSIPADENANDDLVLFSRIWNSLEDSDGLRGWSETSAAGVVKSIQSLDEFIVSVFAAELAPFPGDTKILLLPKAPAPDGSTQVVLRLRESDEESCLWRLRCQDGALRLKLRHLLSHKD